MNEIRRQAVGVTLTQVQTLVRDFEEGLIAPIEIPLPATRSDSSDRLDSIEATLFHGETDVELTPEARNVFRRQWAAFRLARFFGGDALEDVSWAMRHIVAGELLTRPDDLRLSVLLDLLDSAPDPLTLN
jgi:hypothetical protein